MRRLLPSLVLTFVVMASAVTTPAQAQQMLAANSLTSTTLFPVTPVAAAPVAPAPARLAEAPSNADAAQGPTFVNAGFAPRTRRPLLLPALYVSQAALQALDAHSTYSAINRGAHEVNPLMKGVVGNKPAMLAVKAGVAASTIWIAERMWKKGNRAAAIATMIVANVVTGAVVANNYKVASGLRAR
jgi:Domain of unknown function (DUF5658)